MEPNVDHELRDLVQGAGAEPDVTLADPLEKFLHIDPILDSESSDADATRRDATFKKAIEAGRRQPFQQQALTKADPEAQPDSVAVRFETRTETYRDPDTGATDSNVWKTGYNAQGHVVSKDLVKFL